MANRIEELNYVPEMPEKARNIVIVGAGGLYPVHISLLIRWPGIQ